jgi:hypothetical protein
MKIALIFFISLCGIISFSQTNNTDWQISPFSNLGFTENLNRYDQYMDEKVQFFADYGPCKIYFSNDAFVFSKPEELSKKEIHERHEKMEHGEMVEPIVWNYFKIEFENTTIESTIQPTEIQRHTRHFQNPDNLKETIKAKNYRVLIYKNLYPNIDMKVELPEQGGLKYSFYVHPGGNYSSIRMKYTNADINLLESGQLEIKSACHDFIDAKPESKVGEKKIKSDFVLQNNEITFNVDDYDKGELLIIDPWVTADVPFDEDIWDTNYDIAFDNAGRCVLSGGQGPGSYFRKVAQYTDMGELNWVYEGLYGSAKDVATNPANGDIYPLAFWQPGQLDKINLFGVLFGEYEFRTTEGIPGLVEARAVKFNATYDELCVAQGGLYQDTIPLLSKLDLNLTVWDWYEVLAEEGSLSKDPVMFDLDPDGESIYFAITNSYGDVWHSFSNIIYKVDYSDPNTIYWETNSNYILDEGFQRNGMACGEDFLFTIHGNSLKKWNKDSGIMLDSVVLDNPYAGGIDTDPCGSVYIGFEDSIVMFNSSLEQLSTFDIPSKCTDIMINGNLLYACGNTFVTQLSLDVFDVEIAVTADSCGSCTGTASIDSVGNCHQYDLDAVSWSPSGQTTSTAIDLCAGWHIANSTWISEAGETVEKIDSVEVLFIDESDLVIDLGNDTTICEEAMFVLDAGSGFASFEWQDGSTDQTLTISASGVYWVEAQDQNGCTVVDSINIDVISCLGVNEFEPNLIAIFPNPFNDFTTVNFGQVLTDMYVVIYNGLGQEVYRNENLNTESIRIEKKQLGAGVYLFSVRNNGDNKEVFTTKLVVE